MKKTVKILLAWVLALVCVMTVPGMSVAAATAAHKEEAQVSEEVLEEVSEDVTEEREETAEEVTQPGSGATSADGTVGAHYPGSSSGKPFF